MTTYVDERGPYVLELASNADARRRGKWSRYWADELLVAPNGKFAYAASPLAPAWKYMILFLPYGGAGEPRPIEMEQA